MLSTVIKATAAALAIALPGLSFAADFPTKPITLIVPYQARGTVETMGRVLADELGKQLDGKVLVKTQPGAGGKIGTTATANAPADGYTIGLIPDSTILWPVIAEEVGYDLDSFTPLVTVAALQQALVTSKTSGIATFEDLIAASRAGKLSYADQNSISRAYVDYIAAQEGVDWVAVPTKGGGEMVPFLLGGKVDFAWSGGAHNRYLDDMNVVLAMTADPLTMTPDVPTIQEKYGVAMPTGTTVWTPAGLPEDVKDKLEAASIAAAQSEAFTALLKDNLGFPAVAISGEELTRTLDEVNANLVKVYETTRK